MKTEIRMRMSPEDMKKLEEIREHFETKTVAGTIRRALKYCHKKIS